MPFAPPVLPTASKKTPEAPMAVSAMFTTVPVVVSAVVETAPESTLTVPPLVAVNAALAPVSRSRPPEKVIVEPPAKSLLSRKMPRPLSSMAPERATVLPPPWSVTSTERPAAVVEIEPS